MTTALEPKDRNACFIVCIGIPGSGKTKFCKTLIQAFVLSGKSEYVLEHICYDDLIQYTLDEGEYRKSRDGILASVVERANKFKLEAADGKILLLVIDDNNYYLSMRRMYYKAANHNNIGYCQVSFECDEKLATERVKARNAQPGMLEVPLHVIEAMSNKLESPNMSTDMEADTIFISPESMPTLDGNWFYFLPKSCEVLSLVETIERTAHNSFAKIKAKSRELAKKAEKKEVCSPSKQKNLHHELDLTLRMHISGLIDKARSTPAFKDKDEVKALSAKLHKNKNEVLASFRGDKELSFDMFDDIVESFSQNCSLNNDPALTIHSISPTKE